MFPFQGQDSSPSYRSYLLCSIWEQKQGNPICKVSLLRTRRPLGGRQRAHWLLATVEMCLDDNTLLSEDRIVIVSVSECLSHDYSYGGLYSNFYQENKNPFLKALYSLRPADKTSANKYAKEIGETNVGKTVQVDKSWGIKHILLNINCIEVYYYFISIQILFLYEFAEEF